MYFKGLVLAGLLPYAVSARMLEFDCNKIPAVCINMCWGAYCKGNGVALNYDHPTDAQKMTRKKASGCAPNPNRCANVDGHNCDEYPFMSVLVQGGGSTRVNRCVPVGQNGSQGKSLMKFFTNSCSGVNPCDFDVVFGNPGGVMYCQVNQGVGNCDNDGHEEVGPNASRRDVSTGPLGKYYLLASGKVILGPVSASIGDTVTRVVPINGTLYDEQLEADEDDDVVMDNLVLQDDHIVKEVKDAFDN